MRTRQKELQQRPFARREIDRLVVNADALGGHVDRESADRQAARGRRGAAQQRAHARLEFGHRERLGQVVVGAEVEAVHAVLDRIARGQHQHAGRRAPRTQASQDLEAVDVGQPDVEHDEIEVLGSQKQVRVAARRRLLHRVARAGQRRRQPVDQQGIILYDEYAHRGSGAFIVGAAECRRHTLRRAIHCAREASGSPAVGQNCVLYPTAKPCGRISIMNGVSRLWAYHPERPPTAQPASTSVCQCAWFLIRAAPT